MFEWLLLGVRAFLFFLIFAMLLFILSRFDNVDITIGDSSPAESVLD